MLIQNVIKLFEKEKIISNESEVLDIGCGPGTYVLPLAKKVKKVFALDPAKNMLNVVMEEAKRNKIENIVPILCKWADYKVNRKFDLVFASLSPAIDSIESLMKMNELSGNYVCLISYSKTNEIKIRNEIFERIMKKPPYSFAYNIIFPFIILYLSGFSPNLHFLKFEFKTKERIQDLMMQYENYFKIFTDNDKDLKVLKYIKSISKNGMIKDKIEKEIAVMWWRSCF